MTTGIAIPRSGAEQRAYLERLDDAGVAALALSEKLHVPPLRREFLAAADRRGMPVLEVPLPVPFIAVAQEVAAAVQADVGQRLGAQLQVFGAVRWITEENLDIADIFVRLERLSGYDLFVCTPHRRPLLPGVRIRGQQPRQGTSSSSCPRSRR